MNPKHPYYNTSQQRILRVMLLLFGHEIDGLAPSQLAQTVGASASAITRDIYNLIDAGVAERLPHNDNVRIHPMMGAKAMQVLTALDQAEKRLAETRSRFTRTELSNAQVGQIFNEIFAPITPEERRLVDADVTTPSN